MSNKANNFLKMALGQDFFETLSKAELWKPGTKTTIDPEEIATALHIVPRTVMAMLIRELVPLSIGDRREILLPFGKEAKLKIDKHERDVYSGHIEDDKKIIVDFKFRSLPGVGLVIMSAFELYDVQELTKEPTTLPEASPDIEHRVQKLIDERLQLHELINKVVDRKLMQKEAVQHLVLAKLTEAIHQPAPIEHHEIAKKEGVVEVKKKGSPLKSFLESKKKKSGEIHIEMSKGESVHCPDCKKNIFDGKVFSGCICLGDDMERKVFIKKTEDGINVRFSKGWDEENISMLLEVLRKKNG